MGGGGERNNCINLNNIDLLNFKKIVKPGLKFKCFGF